MAAMKKALIAGVVAAFAAFIGYGFLKLKEITLADREVPVKHLKCQYLQNIEYGAEDITILKDGLAFLSTGLKYSILPSFSDDPGKMYIVDLLHPKPTPVELQIKGDLDLSSFNPHGISVYTDEADDSVYLFVVNHPQNKSQVEIFRYAREDTLVHLKTITHPLLHRYVLCKKPFTASHVLYLTVSLCAFSNLFIAPFSVNDIVAVGVESFYATNDHYYHNDILSTLFLILSIPLCEVVYYSPEEVRVAAGGFLSPNGINISPDKRHIYVSDIVGHEVHVFERHEGEQLAKVKSVGVGSLCDNIDVDHRTGDLWLGCHPNSMKLSKYNPEDPPGSEIIRIQNILSEHPVVSQEYVDDGHVIMASTIAAPYGGKLLIGSAFHKALCCDLK
ncbi:serum paraoxonase/arylesterase 2-like isoform X1 [Chaetodon trifascialis]|uniref:serum paraoxonase/arylesterase 2-like isoform X1 n=1 Tax=Chaetodon trifascialis TaxID=109706 RepID=UPI00399184A2